MQPNEANEEVSDKKNWREELTKRLSWRSDQTIGKSEGEEEE